MSIDNDIIYLYFSIKQVHIEEREESPTIWYLHFIIFD